MTESVSYTHLDVYKRQGRPQETVDELFDRVSRAIAEADKNFDPQADIDAVAKQFRDMMTNLEFLPNSPTLMNAGRPLGQLSACLDVDKRQST